MIAISPSCAVMIESARSRTSSRPTAPRAELRDGVQVVVLAYESGLVQLGGPVSPSPRIRFEDGSVYREESKEMARAVSGGLLPNLGSSSLRPRN
jgi:hypothetical protein